MIKKILIIIVLILFMFVCFKMNFDGGNDGNNINNKSIIHSPKLNKGFFINEYNDYVISRIQLSLNKRDNIYQIKENKLFMFGEYIKDLYDMC